MAKKKTKKAAKKAASAETSEEVFYVGIQDPVEIRRNILEASKDMVNYLQHFERLRALRKEKQESIHHLKEDVKELKALVNRLRALMPKTKLRLPLHEEHNLYECPQCKKGFTSAGALSRHKKVAHQPVKRKKAKAVKVTPTPAKGQTQLVAAPEIRKPMTEIEKLESELADIENKLGRLS